MLDYLKLTIFFDEYIEHYKEFLKFEYLKLDMINNDDIEKLSNSLSIEQAFIAKTNSYEGRRLKLLGENTELTFAQIIEGAPAAQKVKLDLQHKELTETVYKIKELNDIANSIVTERLKRIQNKTAELDTYNVKGNLKREHASRVVISKNV